MSNPIITEQKINAPAEKVWKALTDKEEMKVWYFDITDFELEAGKIFNFYEPGEEKKYHHQAEILEIFPNEKFIYSWAYPDFSDKKTTVIWELQPDGSGTWVRLIHNDIEHFSDLGEHFSREAFTDGWNGIILQSLKPYLES